MILRTTTMLTRLITFLLHVYKILFYYVAKKVLWIKDLKLRHLIAVDNYCSDTIPATSNVGTSNSYNHDVSVELIVGKTRKRDQYNILLSFEDTLTKNNW